VVALQYATAEELAQQLNVALMESESRAEQLKKRLPAIQPERDAASRAFVVPSPDSNRLILVGTTSQIAFLKSIIAQMDLDVPSGRGRLNAIFLKYISAEEASKSINALLEKSAAKDASGAQARRIAIEAGAANNALLVDASPGDYRVVADLVNQLDSPREQVHIEVMIAEVSSGSGLTLGVEMASLGTPGAVGDTVVQGSSQFGEGSDSILNSIQQGLFPRGLTFGVSHGTRLDASGNLVADYAGLINIDAVRADSRLKIVSETALEAQNNQEATLSIVDEIPILKSTIQGGSGSSRDVIQNIDRIEVGIKLTLTPHVIPGGLVRMELNPKIEAFIEPLGGGDRSLTPTIARREVSTTVTVPDRRTIVIAGLTRHDQARAEQRVPILGSIPLLGWLFRHKVNSEESTDLLILVTPRIVSDAMAMQQVKKQWQTKTGLPGDKSK
jgi:general secretion pathway protein D